MALPDLSKYEKYEQLTQGKVRYYEAGSGKDVLLLHGMGVYTSADTFQFQFEALAEKYHVVAMDYLGFGNSDRVLGNGPTFDVIVDGIREFLDIKGLEQVHIVGHSAGPWFGGILTYESPDRVLSLTGIGSAGMNATPVASVSGYQAPTAESTKASNMNSVYEGSSLTEEMAGEMGLQMLKYANRDGAVDGLRPLVNQMADADVRKSYLLQRRLPLYEVPCLFHLG
jgi:pyruvate dehydrogenase E2 component (dihydrolipoamide acetyltransferase)